MSRYIDICNYIYIYPRRRREAQWSSASDRWHRCALRRQRRRGAEDGGDPGPAPSGDGGEGVKKWWKGLVGVICLVTSLYIYISLTIYI